MSQQKKQEQAPCLLVVGIILAALGFGFGVWFLIAVGGFLFIIGICLIIQQANQPKNIESQTTSQPAQQQVAQPVVQSVPQPLTQPAPEQVPESHRFCPHCGAQATGKYCTDCGTEID